MAEGKVVVVKNEEEMKAALAAATGAVALEFIAKDCQFCDDEKPEVDALAQKCAGLTVLRIDVDDMPALADQYLVGEDSGTPTIFYAKKAVDLQPGKAKELEDSTALRKRMKCSR